MFPVTGLRQDSNAKNRMQTTVRFRKISFRTGHATCQAPAPSTGCPAGFAPMNRLFLSLCSLGSHGRRMQHSRAVCRYSFNWKNGIGSVYLNQQERGIDEAALGQALRRHAKRLANEQDSLAMG